MEMTTQAKVAGIEMDICKAWDDTMIMHKSDDKWTYAIPLEIVYMTPLLSWNPYGLQYKDETTSTLGQTVTANSRWGSSKITDFAYDGTNSKLYYLTPHEFFISNEQGSSEADTVKGTLGPFGNVRKVKASVQGHSCRTYRRSGRCVHAIPSRYPIIHDRTMSVAPPEDVDGNNSM